MKSNPTPLLHHTCELGEGPVWDEQNQRLLWVDILRGELHQYNTKTKDHRFFSVGQMIGSFALNEKGGFVAAVKDGFVNIDGETGIISGINNHEIHLTKNRFNEGKCDPSGRFWAGSMSLNDETGAGALYMLDHDFSVHRKRDNISISNGMAWSLDGKKMYYIDTPTYRVMAFDFDEKTGSIRSPVSVIEIKTEDGSPDGMTIDTEGKLWIAHWDGWQITRWNPATGKLLSRISIPAARVTSCIFGGPTFEDLYITTAKTGLTYKQLNDQPLAGSLFVIKDCGFKGLPATKFKSAN